jgi:hypothetical protein
VFRPNGIGRFASQIWVVSDYRVGRSHFSSLDKAALLIEMLCDFRELCLCATDEHYLRTFVADAMRRGDTNT